MDITYIHHSGFLVETACAYYLFDYEKGALPAMDVHKPVFVLSSHSHSDHYNPHIFSQLTDGGMQVIRAILSEDITPPDGVDTLSVAPNREYRLSPTQKLTTYRSTDLGVAFLIEEEEGLIYHAGDLNDWVWDEETADYNRQMTQDYRQQISLLAERLQGSSIDVAFLVLDPRQEADYDRGMQYFLQQISVRQVYPMHYWDQPAIIDTFSKDHPQYAPLIQNTEKFALRAEKR